MMSSSWGPANLDTQKTEAKEFTMNLAQAAATYDLLAASGDVIILGVDLYVATVGATLTSVALQTDDTTSVPILSAVEGAVANITAGKNLKNFSTPFLLRNGKKIQYTIVGATGSGSIIACVRFMRATAGASIA